MTSILPTRNSISIFKLISIGIALRIPQKHFLDMKHVIMSPRDISNRFVATYFDISFTRLSPAAPELSEELFEMLRDHFVRNNYVFNVSP